MKREKHDRTFVYVLSSKENGLYKIGYTTNFFQRFKALKTGNPTLFALHLFVAPNSTERMLHKIFKQKKTSGEWFRLTDAELSSIPTIVYGETPSEFLTIFETFSKEICWFINFGFKNSDGFVESIIKRNLSKKLPKESLSDKEVESLFSYVPSLRDLELGLMVKIKRREGLSIKTISMLTGSKPQTIKHYSSALGRVKNL